MEVFADSDCNGGLRVPLTDAITRGLLLVAVGVSTFSFAVCREARLRIATRERACKGGGVLNICPQPRSIATTQSNHEILRSSVHAKEEEQNQLSLILPLC